MKVTIDGPAGAGKSSVARALAGRLGYEFLDTGAMYRSVALAASRRNIDWNDTEALAQVAEKISITLDHDRVFLDGEDVTTAIRTSAVTAVTRYAADNPQVRQRLVLLQREAAHGKDIVCEGRDQGTVVFPDAQCKIFLWASAQERARRRVLDLKEKGEEASFDEILAQQEARDEQDRNRKVGGLLEADDAINVCSDGLSAEEVVEQLEKLVRSRC